MGLSDRLVYDVRSYADVGSLYRDDVYRELVCNKQQRQVITGVQQKSGNVNSMEHNVDCHSALSRLGKDWFAQWIEQGLVSSVSG